MSISRTLGPCLLVLALSGCADVFDAVAGLFGLSGEPTTEIEGAPVAGETEYAEDWYCYREYRHIKIDANECQRLGGVMVLHDGRPETEGPPKTAPTGKVQIATLDASGAGRKSAPANPDIFMAPSGTAAADLSKIETAPPRCYREYRLIRLTREDCERYGGVFVEDDDKPRPSSRKTSTPSGDDDTGNLHANRAPAPPASGIEANQAATRGPRGLVAESSAGEPTGGTVNRRAERVRRPLASRIAAASGLSENGEATVWNCVRAGKTFRIGPEACVADGGMPIRLISTDTVTQNQETEPASGKTTAVAAAPANTDKTDRVAMRPFANASATSRANAGIGCLHEDELRDWDSDMCAHLGGIVVPVHASHGQIADAGNTPTPLVRGATLLARRDIFLSYGDSRPRGDRTNEIATPIRADSGQIAEIPPTLDRVAPLSHAPRAASTAVPTPIIARAEKTGDKAGISAMVAKLREAFPKGPRRGRVTAGTSAAATQGIATLPRVAAISGPACVRDPHLLALSPGACRALGGNPARRPYPDSVTPLPPNGRVGPDQPDDDFFKPSSPRWRQLVMVP